MSKRHQHSLSGVSDEEASKKAFIEWKCLEKSRAGNRIHNEDLQGEERCLGRAVSRGQRNSLSGRHKVKLSNQVSKTRQKSSGDKDDLSPSKEEKNQKNISGKEGGSSNIKLIMNENLYPPSISPESAAGENSSSYDKKASMAFSLKREKNPTFLQKPTFSIAFMKTCQKPLIYAKMISSNTTTTLIVSKQKENFTENSDTYVGKIKGNFTGSQFNIFGPGWNPNEAKLMAKPARELLATIQYEASNFSLFSEKKPRNFKVFMLKPGKKYSQLIGRGENREEIPLSQLYKLNKQSILLMTNRKPQWNEKEKHHVLQFQGRVRKSSVKNFILEDPETKNIRMMFGKLSNDGFRADLWDPLSPYIGFGIALCSFGVKIGCQ